MKISKKTIIIIIIIGALLMQSEKKEAPSSTFTLHSSVVAVPRDVLPNARLMTPWYFWRDQQVGGVYQYQNMPHEATVKESVRLYFENETRIVVDIESGIFFPHDIRRSTTAEVDNTMMVFGQIIDWIHEERPDMQICIYRHMPIRDYLAPVRNIPANLAAWRAANEYLRPLSQKVDYICPQLYAYYDNESEWNMSTKGNLIEAEIYGKPIYPFLMPQYHPGAEPPSIRFEWIDGDFWRSQLDAVHEEVDQAILYAMWETDTTDDWWQVTLQKLAENNSPLELSPSPIRFDNPTFIIIAAVAIFALAFVRE